MTSTAFGSKTLDSLILEVDERPARQTDAAREGCPQGRKRTARRYQQEKSEDSARHGAENQEGPLRPGEACLSDANLDAHPIARFLLELELLEALRDLIPPAHGGDPVASFRTGRRQRLLAFLGLGIAGEERIQKDIGDPARCERGETDGGELGVDHTRVHKVRGTRRSRLSRVPGRLSPPSRRGPLRASFPRRSSAPVPRTGDGRCPWSGGGR
jgi:hypothetical protein